MTGQKVHFDASASNCNASPCTYTWEDDPPGGGTWPLGTGQTLDFTFQGVGTKYVTLIVADATSSTATVEHDVVVASAPTAPPTNTALPTISGTPQQGNTLTESDGTWTGSPTSYSYQWLVCDSAGTNCSTASGETDKTYVLGASDVGHTIRGIDTATNAGGSTPATTAATPVITAATVSAPSNTALPTISGTATQGQTLSTTNGTWTGSPTSYAYQWRDCDTSGDNCTNITGATSSTYTLTSQRRRRHPPRRRHRHQRRRLGLRHLSSVRGRPETGPPAAAALRSIGTAAPPNVSCTTTISAGASVQNALAAASPGQIVCLNAGNWPQQTITGLTPASPSVTLAAKPGATVTMAGMTTNGTVNNLTVEGIKFTAVGFHVLASGNNITVQYNTFETFADYAVEGCPACTVSSNDLSNFKVLYNQIDHTAYCLRAAANNMSNWTFSHNVCGPGIGYGGNSDDHYTQVECIDGMTMDNNAFLGPFDSSALNNGVHNNVTHACGDNLEFNNNVVWHADSRAQTLLWGDDGSVNTARANNNLFVEDPQLWLALPHRFSVGGERTRRL